MIKKIGYSLAAVLITLSLPASALADTTGDPSSAPTVGVNAPVGADAATFTYNSTTGLWENQYFSWNPVTGQRTAKTSQAYVYNPATGMWEKTTYVYDAPSGQYVPVITSSPTDPLASTQANVTTSASSADPSVAQTTTSPNSISDTGPNSSNTTNSNANNNTNLDSASKASLNNTLGQNATSGNASVLGNTNAGSALTGNAIDVNNVINMLESSFGLQNAANLMTFTQNINGNVNGDITIDPNQLAQTGPGSINVDNSNTKNNLTINSASNNAITNNITMGATSGNATVADNTNAGDATSGNANTVANIVNEINSAISANKSFLGVININGNLNGDILLPPNFIDQLLASNAPHTTVTLSNNLTNNLTVNNTNNETVNNNVNLTAQSGAATVSGNTNAGSATTGTAGTNLTIFNLTGHDIVSKNNILVFVNVLGKWVGLIMNAPAGTTAADIGGNVSANNTVTNNATINSVNNDTITNNLRLASKSGDAAVTDNTTAGNATSGDASSSANIANILNSKLSASDWFGLLFINVFGTWNGSFGVNTAAGDIAAAESAAGGPTGGNLPVFGFIPTSGSGGSNMAKTILANFNQPNNQNNSPTGNNNQIILASSTGRHGGGSAPTETIPDRSGSHSNAWVLPLASFGAVMLLTGSLGYSGEFATKLQARLLNNRLSKS